MSMPRWLRRFRARLRYRHIDRDLRQELDVHRAMSEDAFAATGTSAEAARTQAARALGNVTVAREDARGVWLAPWIERLSQDVRYAIRGFRRTPAFTLFALGTLALGIGATTAAFAVVNGVLLKPLPYPNPDQLVAVVQSATKINVPDAGFSAADYFVFRDHNRTFEDCGIYVDYKSTVIGAGDPERVDVMAVTDGVLPVLGVSPFAGRLFTRHDDSPGSAASVIVSYDYWRSRLGENPSAIGRRLSVDGVPREIIGVLPLGFRFPSREPPSLFLPMQLDRAKTTLADFEYEMVARLRPGVTLAQANADVAPLPGTVLRAFPPPSGASVAMFESAGLAAEVQPLARQMVGDVGHVLWIVMGAIGLVLLITCANVGSLCLVRAEGRRQEFAVRAALGAGARRMAAGLAVESLVLGLAGGTLGLAVAFVAVRALVALAPADLPRIDDITIDATTIMFALAVSLVASALFGSAPFLHRPDRRLAAALRGGGRSASSTRAQHRARHAFVIVEVALALVVLIGSGLMIRTFRALTRVAPGFAAPASVQTFRLSIPETEAADSERVVRLEQAIMERLAAVPGVSTVGLATTVPMHGQSGGDPIFDKDRTYREGQLPPVRHFEFILPGFFTTLGTPVIAGRDLTWDDVYRRRPVALVSENIARELWGGAAAAIGHHIRTMVADGQYHEVIGVVADIHSDGMDKDAPATVYWPVLMSTFWGQTPFIRRDAAFVLRSNRAGTKSLQTDIKQAVWAIDPNLPIAEVHTLDDFYRQSMARTTFTLVMLLAAGGMGLLLGVIGLYSVIAYAVSQRTREIGIRAALGAEPTSLTGLFVRQGLRLGASGVVIGAAAAVAASRAMTSLLFHVRPVDPTTYIIAAAGLLVITALASYLPARRAMRVDPAVTLRQE